MQNIDNLTILFNFFEKLQIVTSYLITNDH
jgi:hypothetical protein